MHRTPPKEERGAWNLYSPVPLPRGARSAVGLASGVGTASRRPDIRATTGPAVHPTAVPDIFPPPPARRRRQPQLTGQRSCVWAQTRAGPTGGGSVRPVPFLGPHRHGPRRASASIVGGAGAASRLPLPAFRSVALHAGGAPRGNVSLCITAILTSLDDGDTDTL